MRRRTCTYPPFPKTNAQTNHATKNPAETIQVYKPAFLPFPSALLRRGLDRTFRQLDRTQPDVRRVAADEHPSAVQ